MIKISISKTAIVQNGNEKNVTKEILKESSIQHIEDVRQGITYIKSLLDTAAHQHDSDKLTDLDAFHKEFITNFKSTTWWDKHRQISRHHLSHTDGVRHDVHLVDVIEMIVDCVMAGMSRNGFVKPITIHNDVLKLAFDNTVQLMKKRVVLAEETQTKTDD